MSNTEQSKTTFNPKSFGVVVSSLGVSQLSYALIHNLNLMVQHNQNFAPIIFFKNYAKPLQIPHFPIMQVKELWTYNFPTIAVDLETARLLLDLPVPNPKYFYVWELEWLYLDHIDYDELKEIYVNDDIKLIGRNKYYSQILEQAWKKPVIDLEEWNWQQLTKIIGEGNGKKG